MSHAISSEDMLAICLILSDYDTNTSTDEVFKRVESYQQSQSDYFGETDNDFRMVFVHLGVDFGWFGWDVVNDFAAKLGHIPIRQWITPILEHYDYAWFNDSEEGWCAQVDDKGRHFKRKEIMLDFFKNPENDSPEKIRHFLEDRLGWKKQYIREFLTHVIYGRDVYADDNIVFADENDILRLRQ
jgi:hypothetical protein